MARSIGMHEEALQAAAVVVEESKGESERAQAEGFVVEMRVARLLHSIQAPPTGVFPAYDRIEDERGEA